MNYLLLSLVTGLCGLAAGMATTQPNPVQTNNRYQPPIRATTIIFIHGAFVSPDCWKEWKAYFEALGYQCLVLPWPGRGQAAASQRANHPDPKRGQQTLAEVVAFYADILRKMPAPPILIGHSLGGLLVQLLLTRGVAAAGVAIHSAPPRGVAALKWSFLRCAWPLLNTFVSAKKPFLFSFKQFQYAFTNGWPLAEQRAAYDRLIIPESRRVARGTLGKTGAVEYHKTVAPLLLTAGGQDNILPWALQRRNFRRYRNAPAAVSLFEFPDRTHSVLGQPGWETVAAAVAAWLRTH